VNFWGDGMTTDENPSEEAAEQQWLSFNPSDMAGMRLRQADVARLFGVSRQTVSSWAKRRIITVGPDGLIDPIQAAREVMHRTNTQKLRARVFRNAMEDHSDLREENERLQRRAEEAEAQLQKTACELEFLWKVADVFHALLTENAHRLRTTETNEYFCDQISDLWFEAEAQVNDQRIPDEGKLASGAEMVDDLDELVAELNHTFGNPVG